MFIYFENRIFIRRKKMLIMTVLKIYDRNLVRYIRNCFYITRVVPHDLLLLNLKTQNIFTYTATAAGHTLLRLHNSHEIKSPSKSNEAKHMVWYCFFFFNDRPNTTITVVPFVL